MENSSNKKKTNLFSTIFTLVIIFVILVLQIATFAWLSNSKTADGNGLSVVIDPVSGIALQDLIILKREGADKATDVSDKESIAITEYDAIFTDRNINTPIIIKASINGLPKDDEGNYIAFSNVVYWVKSNPWYREIGNQKVLTHYLSNVVSIRCSLATEELNAIEDSDELYSASIEYLNEHSENKSFVHVTDLGSSGGEHNNYSLDSKDDSISFSFTPEQYLRYMHNGSITLLIEITYNEQLFDVYASTSDLEIGETSYTDIVIFDGDLTDFVIKEGIE